MQEIKNEIKLNELESVNNARDKEIEYLAIEDLTPYENNARTHDEYQIEKLKNSLKEFGFINPVIIDENNMILVGHGRIMGAKELGIKTVPCIRIKYLTYDQKKAYILADNKLSDLGGWDLDLLNEEFKNIEIDMSDFGFDIGVFDSDEYGTVFELPDGEKGNIEQMTFTLSGEQATLIRSALDMVKDEINETFGNENKNGNAIYEVVRQWVEQRIS